MFFHVIVVVRPLVAARSPPSCSFTIPSQMGRGGENIMEMLMSRGRARRSLTNHCPRQNRLDLRKINLLPIKIELDGVKKKNKKTSPNNTLN